MEAIGAPLDAPGLNGRLRRHRCRGGRVPSRGCDAARLPARAPRKLPGVSPTEGAADGTMKVRMRDTRRIRGPACERADVEGAGIIESVSVGRAASSRERKAAPQRGGRWITGFRQSACRAPDAATAKRIGGTPPRRALARTPATPGYFLRQPVRVWFATMQSAWRLAARAARWSLALAALALVGCASAPRPGSGSASRPAPGAVVDPARDGPEASPPAGLEQVPDAEPRVEPIRVGGPNKPYEALGREYVPMTQDRPYTERGLASWYGRKFHGKRTSSGEPYDMYAMTAAHPTLPIPSYARVRNPANGREIVVRVNDRGPFHPGRIIDLSYTAALKLDLLRGVAPVEVQRLTFEDIRAGTWRRTAPDDGVRLAARGAGAPASRGEVAVPAGLVAPVAQTRGDGVAAASRTEGATASTRAEAPTRAEASTRAEVATAADLSTPLPAPGAVAVAPATESGAPPAAAPTLPPASLAPAPGYWIQLGAFRQRAGADAFQRRVAEELAWLSPRLSVWDDASLYRLQAGPYASRDEARGAADNIRSALQLVPVIVERR